MWLPPIRHVVIENIEITIRADGTVVMEIGLARWQEYLCDPDCVELRDDGA